MLEQSVPIDETMIEITASVAAGANIMRAGEDIKSNYSGAMPMNAGHRPSNRRRRASAEETPFFAQVER
jgi:hypothetical protein